MLNVSKLVKVQRTIKGTILPNLRSGTVIFTVLSGNDYLKQYIIERIFVE